MATIEERKYKDKETGKVTVRYRAKIRLKGFAPEECTFPTKTLAKEWAAKREMTQSGYKELLLTALAAE